ncbi:MAG: zf-HC2 domain-containing protein [Desulfobulbaceae bacterium]|nr:zf-HC2 domain-containing protein [Desulfobulbaceae bacterium]HIJ77791.1 zf-HC2 domain-containing protein [Deltaproteobacteria bacterium]
MECKKVCELLDDYFDNLLTNYEGKVIESHLLSCEKCSGRYSREAAFRKKLKGLSSPAMSAEFSANIFQSVYQQHTRQQGRANRLTMIGGAIAAVFVMFIYLGIAKHSHLPAKDEVAGRTTLTLSQTKRVKLLVTSPRNLENATITIMLPEQIALAGYPEKREISWIANLSQGNNLLTIPLVGTKEGLVSVTTRIDHLNRRKELQFQMQINRDRQTTSADKTLHLV